MDNIVLFESISKINFFISEITAILRKTCVRSATNMWYCFVVETLIMWFQIQECQIIYQKRFCAKIYQTHNISYDLKFATWTSNSFNDLIVSKIFEITLLFLELSQFSQCKFDSRIVNGWEGISYIILIPCIQCFCFGLVAKTLREWFALFQV